MTPMRPITYSPITVLLASPDKPMALARRRHQLTRMWGGLANMEQADQPTPDDWRVCSDAVNLVETLVRHGGGHWRDCDGDLVHITDERGLLDDAVTALGQAGERAMAGKPLRLDAAGIQAVRAVLEDYASLLDALPERTIVAAHRVTEKRIRAILAGKNHTHDVVVDF